ncbi:MAG: hypothetical protein WB729_18235 [Candidatus Sulfotelmatobacter sp.]
MPIHRTARKTYLSVTYLSVQRGKGSLLAQTACWERIGAHSVVSGYPTIAAWLRRRNPNATRQSGLVVLG